MSQNNKNLGYHSQNQEKQDIRIPGSWSSKNVMMVDGMEIETSSVGHTKAPDGTLIHQKKLEYEIVADGRILPTSAIVGDSYTGLRTPRDCWRYCLNPFGCHSLRSVYLEIDGKQTDLGNILCDYCWEAYKKRKKRQTWTLGLYHQEDI